MFDGDDLRDLDVERKNRATGAHRGLHDRRQRRDGALSGGEAVPDDPARRARRRERWDRIVELAREHGTALPPIPDSTALDAFLVKARAADPERFPDLSLSVIKLLGAGEYVAEQPGRRSPGHFGLAVKDYTHSTAPNRRYADLVTQRLLKAAHRRPAVAVPLRRSSRRSPRTAPPRRTPPTRWSGRSASRPRRCCSQSRIGEQFDALVTGASDKGTWARLLALPVEGRVERGFQGMDVGEQVRVQLLSVDVERGFIDFAGLGSTGHMLGARRQRAH